MLFLLLGLEVEVWLLLLRQMFKVRDEKWWWVTYSLSKKWEDIQKEKSFVFAFSFSCPLPSYLSGSQTFSLSLSFLSLFSLSLLSLFLSHNYYMMLMLQLVGYGGGSESALIRKWTPRPLLSNTVLLSSTAFFYHFLLLLSSITFLPLTFLLLKNISLKVNVYDPILRLLINGH